MRHQNMTNLGLLLTTLVMITAYIGAMMSGPSSEGLQWGAIVILAAAAGLMRHREKRQ